MMPEFLSRPTPAAVLAALPGARAVGGAVRDNLAGRPTHDVDVGAPYPPDVIAARLREAGLRVYETGLSHGTVTALLENDPQKRNRQSGELFSQQQRQRAPLSADHAVDWEGVEVTALRRDTSTDGRHAQVEWITDWREDAARRDFTINAMSMGADGVLHDYFGGAEDLRAGRVRFVGDAAARIAEDYLRALRFFRFWARYGVGAPDAAAVAAIRDAVPGLERLSRERVWMEIKRLMQAPDPRDALRLMAQLGVLEAVLPEAGDASRLDTLLAHEAAIDPLLRVAVLVRVGADLERLRERLRLSDDEAQRLRALHDLRDLDAPSPHEARARIRARTTRATAGEMLFVAAAEDPAAAALIPRMGAAPGPDFPLQGRDAIAAGITPGPRMGTLLAATRDWWLDAGAQADHSACLAKLKELAQNPPP